MSDVIKDMAKQAEAVLYAGLEEATKAYREEFREDGGVTLEFSSGVGH